MSMLYKDSVSELSLGPEIVGHDPCEKTQN